MVDDLGIRSIAGAVDRQKRDRTVIMEIVIPAYTDFSRRCPDKETAGDQCQSRKQFFRFIFQGSAEYPKRSQNQTAGNKTEADDLVPCCFAYCFTDQISCQSGNDIDSAVDQDRSVILIEKHHCFDSFVFQCAVDLLQKTGMGIP